MHQFDKVELVRLAKSVKSREVLDILCKDIEYLLKKLNLTYRINLLDVADIGFVSFKQFDFEV
ncbi:hypothetical protein E5P55_00265 [Candidatus Pinguicoccus supinus]|uniref:Seryl-tRNA(Ser/Sec) synthetase n=1 Tax=Candidatus Pinguicoccus supinus TaxID=2529394 RepID=A0A7T0FXP4_9BACT|nr:hypothetical protein E5P55_00265 [Candidatus Pinguicoccus supinus]